MKRVGCSIVCHRAAAFVETPVAQQSIFRAAQPAVFQIIHLARGQGAIPQRDFVHLTLKSISVIEITTDLERFGAGGRAGSAGPVDAVSQIAIHI